MDLVSTLTKFPKLVCHVKQVISASKVPRLPDQLTLLRRTVKFVTQDSIVSRALLVVLPVPLELTVMKKEMANLISVNLALPILLVTLSVQLPANLAGATQFLISVKPHADV